jgi:hypothetical protein
MMWQLNILGWVGLCHKLDFGVENQTMIMKWGGICNFPLFEIIPREKCVSNPFSGFQRSNLLQAILVRVVQGIKNDNLRLKKRMTSCLNTLEPRRNEASYYSLITAFFFPTHVI